MNIKNLILGIAIFILTVSVGIYGINTFYGAEPKYESYCVPSYSLINSSTACESINGTWQVYPVEKNIQNNYYTTGYCDTYRTCQPLYDAAVEKYSKGVFVIALPLGILIIAIGAIAFGLEFVGAGLMAGGVGILFFGVVNYWRFADDWIKFVLSAAGLVVVVLVGYYFNRRR